jgi:hypothetical protein
MNSQLKGISIGQDKMSTVLLGYLEHSMQWQAELINTMHAQDWRYYREGENGRIKKDYGARETFSGKLKSSVEKDTHASLRRKMIGRLKFPTLRDRHFQIPNAHQLTYQWIFQKDDYRDKKATNFASWCERGEGVFWITGKPASGKSILTKTVFDGITDSGLLESWASATPKLAIAGYFFWKAGSAMQKSQAGLLQTLLYEVLRQQPFLAMEVFPDRWEAYTLFGDYFHAWSWPELKRAFDLLIEKTRGRVSLFMVIDGLDECEDNHEELVELLLTTIREPHVKLCLGSRPEQTFKDAFGPGPSLRMQDLTFPDIVAFVNDKLCNSQRFLILKKREPHYATSLIRSVAGKSAGVFLWVSLVVRSLLEGMKNSDRIADLEKRLAQIPPELDDLYSDILKSLDPFYLDHASQIFQIARVAPEALSLLDLSFADEEPDFAIRTKTCLALSDEEVFLRCEDMERRLNTRCRGLLEASGTCEMAAPLEDEVTSDFDPDLSAMNLTNRPPSIDYGEEPGRPNRYAESLQADDSYEEEDDSDTVEEERSDATDEEESGATEGQAESPVQLVDLEHINIEDRRTDGEQAVSEEHFAIRTRGLVPSRRRLPSRSSIDGLGRRRRREVHPHMDFPDPTSDGTTMPPAINTWAQAPYPKILPVSPYAPHTRHSETNSKRKKNTLPYWKTERQVSSAGEYTFSPFPYSYKKYYQSLREQASCSFSDNSLRSEMSQAMYSCSPEATRLLQSGHAITQHPRFIPEVDYLHRTAKDFIERPETWDMLLAANVAPFNPHLSLLRSSLLLLKSLPQGDLTTERFWCAVRWCMRCARQADRTASPGDAYIAILDTMNIAAANLGRSVTSDRPAPERRTGRSQRKVERPHWASTEPGSGIKGRNFICLAVQYDLVRYVKAKHGETSITQDDNGRSMLDYAFSPTEEAHSGVENASLHSRPSASMIKLLLSAGADPNQWSSGGTPWQRALEWLADAAYDTREVPPAELHKMKKDWYIIIKAFVVAGADPKADFNAGGGSYVRDIFGKWDKDMAMRLERLIASKRRKPSVWARKLFS